MFKTSLSNNKQFLSEAKPCFYVNYKKRNFVTRDTKIVFYRRYTHRIQKCKQKSFVPFRYFWFHEVNRFGRWSIRISTRRIIISNCDRLFYTHHRYLEIEYTHSCVCNLWVMSKEPVFLSFENRAVLILCYADSAVMHKSGRGLRWILSISPAITCYVYDKFEADILTIATRRIFTTQTRRQWRWICDFILAQNIYAL